MEMAHPSEHPAASLALADLAHRAWSFAVVCRVLVREESGGLVYLCCPLTSACLSRARPTLCRLRAVFFWDKSDGISVPVTFVEANKRSDGLGDLFQARPVPGPFGAVPPYPPTTEVMYDAPSDLVSNHSYPFF